MEDIGGQICGEWIALILFFIRLLIYLIRWIAEGFGSDDGGSI